MADDSIKNGSSGQWAKVLRPSTSFMIADWCDTECSATRVPVRCRVGGHDDGGGGAVSVRSEQHRQVGHTLARLQVVARAKTVTLNSTRRNHHTRTRDNHLSVTASAQRATATASGARHSLNSILSARCTGVLKSAASASSR